MVYNLLFILYFVYFIESSIYPPYIDNILDYYPGMEHDLPFCCRNCPLGKTKYMLEDRFHFYRFQKGQISELKCSITCLDEIDYLTYITTHINDIVFSYDLYSCEKGRYIQTNNNSIPPVDIYVKKKTI